MTFSTSPLGGTISRSSLAQVNIRAPGNSKPQFLEELYHGSVEEEQDPGVVVLKVSVSGTIMSGMFRILHRFHRNSQ